ncbi:MAG: DegT/DnrJ/EryC1/StrS aminotransferase family protein [Anaerolineae bacterium]|nr:DegT/DnrJ/EryC1/StrS aminotransferase family protein [Anaerolineae bacterium]NUQ05125.1 DegT/DnrJ/EryC1/StrS aminotransferase family protein [Anaerolineae bacterium]
MTLAPIRETFLPFALPDIDQREIDAVTEVVASGWLTTGPKTVEFEKQFAAYLGVKHAVAVNSATAAMHLALEAIGLQRDDEVITSTFTFAATAEVVRYFDAKPVFVDIQRDALNIDPTLIEAAITEHTKAIIPVHVAGQAADLDAIHAVARKYNLRVIDDAAHALPTYYKGRLVGAISDLTSFSFYATKTLATGEGGMITTDNDEWADRCRVMRLHGMSKDAWKRYTGEGSWRYDIIAPGFKYNLTDIASAMGLVQLSKLESMYTRRVEIARTFDIAFEGHPALIPPAQSPDSTHPYHLYILRLNLDALTINRSQFMELLRQANIGASVHWIPLHMHSYYVQTYGYKPEDFPVAAEEGMRCISLPIYSRMSNSDVEDVVTAVRDIADRHLA